MMNPDRTASWDHYAIDPTSFSRMGDNNQVYRIVRASSEAESLNSLDAFKVDALRSELTDLSQTRHPVEHPARNENGTSPELENSQYNREVASSSYGRQLSNSSMHHQFAGPRSFESEVGESVVIDSFNSSMSMSDPSMLARRERMIQHEQQLAMMRQIDPNYPAGLLRPTQHPYQHPTPQYHSNPPEHSFSHPSNSRLSHPIMSGLRQEYGPQGAYGNYASASAIVPSRSRVDSQSEDIGLQHSLTDIAPPDVVVDRSREYHKQHSGDSNAGYSFNTVNLSLQDQQLQEAESLHHHRDDRSPAHPQNIATVSNRVSRNNITGGTAATQAYHTPNQTYGGASAKPAQEQEKTKVFITYANERNNPNHVRTVVQISQTLLKNGIDVIVDVLEEKIRAMSVSLWLEDNIKKSTFVLICISPTYRQTVDGDSDEHAGFTEEEKAVNTRYIYRRIHTEYIKNGSKNYRFIPVLLSGAKVHHIPPWLCDTKVFEWPKDYEDIIYRLFRQERFIRPETGPPPRHTVERYDSYCGRKSSRDSDSDGHTRPKTLS